VHPVIGVSLDPAYTGPGVKVLDTAAPDGTPAVVPDGPAAQAGVRAGDVILAIDGRPVTTSEELIVDIRAREPGDTVTLAVRRGGGSQDVQVTLKADG
jgi:putative serine protease PepD